METQTIITPSGERLVVLSEVDFVRLVEAAEDNADRAAVSEFRRKLAGGEEECIPSYVVDRLLGDENRIKIWREYRGLTATALAHRAGIAQGFLSQIETGKRDGTVETLHRIAEALGVTLDDLAPSHAANADTTSDQAHHRAIEDLVGNQPGLTEGEIASHLFGNKGYQQRVNGDCRLLLREGRVIRRGRGGRADPYRYYLPTMPK